MEINLTFLVQILNFFVTYWFLNKYLFKPVLSSIEKKKEKEVELIDKLAKEEYELLCLQQMKKNQVLLFQKKVDKEYTVTTEKISIPDIPINISVEEKNIENLIEKSKDTIIQKVLHAD